MITIDFPFLITCMFKPAFPLSSIYLYFAYCYVLASPSIMNNFSVSVYQNVNTKLHFVSEDLIAHFVLLPVEVSCERRVKNVLLELLLRQLSWELKANWPSDCLDFAEEKMFIIFLFFSLL